MKVVTERYTLSILDSYSNFDRIGYVNAIKTIKDIKAKYPDNQKLPEVARIKIQQQRRIIKSLSPRMYRCSVYFKNYRHKANFDLEYNARFGKLSKFFKDYVRDILHKFRVNNRNVKDIQTYFGDERYRIEIIGNHFQRGGWVHPVPGQIHTICLKRKVRELYEPKMPKEKYKYVGLELEFCAPIAELDFALKLWQNGVHTYAQMKKDNSLRPKLNEFGYELALLLPEQHFRKNLRQLCKILESVGARADERRCGLHVHLDMRRGRKKDIVYNNLIACQNVFLTFLDPVRHDNEFCHMVKSRKFPVKFENTREERYKTINAAAYYKYKTLEVRMHQGSVNYRDIVNWMELLIKIANHKTRIKKDVNELTDLKKRVRLNTRMNEFFQDKVCFWQLQGPQRRAGIRPAPTTATEVLRTLRDEPAEILDLVEERPQTENRSPNV